MLATVLTTALLTLAAAAPPAATQEAFDFRELAPGVVAAVVNPDVPSYAFANSLIVIGEDGVLVVDTQQSPRATVRVLREIRRRTDRPVRWVVNTHWHGDHTWGNQVYADSFPDARFLATPATRDTLRAVWQREVDRQREHTLSTRQELRAMLPDETDPDRVRRIEAAIANRSAYLDDLAGLRMVLPEPAVTDSLRLDLGGRDVLLIHVGPAHTPGDMLVHLPAEGITMAGDLIEEGELWLEGADVGGWVAALDALRALEPEVLLPGHGGVQTDLELLRSQRAELQSILDGEEGDGSDRR